MIVERPALEHRVTSSLDAGRIPVLLGGCGTGRTSLLLRLEQGLGLARSQYIDIAAAATTPERCLAAILASAARRRPVEAPAPSRGTREAFDALLHYFDTAHAPDGTPSTFLLDEFLDVRTFENFPGLRKVQPDFVMRLASSPTRFVLTSRFTARVHRLLRDAPARFEVIHVPALNEAEVHAMAQRYESGRRLWADDVAPAVTSLTSGRASAVNLLLSTLAAMGPVTDPIAALASQLAPDGALTARCRESYEFRLHRARGYGALKAILGVLAELEPLNLTDIAHALNRTPGSTKDYLSWLEDVDLIVVRGKRYSFDDPLLRLYVRLYGHPHPPTDDDLVREVRGYATARLPHAQPQPVPQGTTVPAATFSSDVSADAARSGIIEID